MSKGVQIAIAMVTVFGGLALILASGSTEGTFQYFENVSSFVQDRTQELTASRRSFRVHGFVVEGSIRKDLPAGHVDFAIRDREQREVRLAVRLVGLDVPDLFKDGAEVVVEGHPEGALFLADRVMAKCPSKYEAKPGTET